jgi:hypothetical protein
MKYKLVSRKNPQKPEEQGKLYAAPVNDCLNYDLFDYLD